MPTKKYSCFCFSLHLKCKKNLVSVILQTAFYPENTMWFKVNMKCQYQPFLLGLFLFFYFFKVAYVSIGIRQLAKNYISRLNNLSQAPTVFFLYTSRYIFLYRPMVSVVELCRWSRNYFCEFEPLFAISAPVSPLRTGYFIFFIPFYVICNHFYRNYLLIFYTFYPTVLWLPI